MDAISRGVSQQEYMMHVKAYEEYKKQVKAYVADLSLDQLYSHENEFDKDLNECDEVFRNYVILRICAKKKLPASEVIEKLDRYEISDQTLRYKFCSQAAKRDEADIVDEFTTFNLQQEATERVAEVILLRNAEKILNNLQEFTTEDKRREWYFLRVLARSTDVIDTLCTDLTFLNSLSSIPKVVLKEIFQKFGYARTYLEKTFNQGEDAFVFLIHNAGNYHAVRNHCPINSLLDELEEKDKGQLLATLLFVKALPNPLQFIKDSRGVVILKELGSLKAPRCRFAVVATALWLQDEGVDILEKIDIKFGAIKSLLIHSVSCYFDCEDKIAVIKSAFGDKKFVQAYSIFVCELLGSERLNFPSKQTVLLNIIQNEKIKVQDLHFCASLIKNLDLKGLLEGKKPDEIAFQSLVDVLAELGEHFNYEISEESIRKLKYHKEIAQYARKLMGISDYDEKERVIRSFFHFLVLLAEGSLEEERKKSPEMEKMFAYYTYLKEEVWNDIPKSTSIGDLRQKYPSKCNQIEEPLDLQEALQNECDQGHLSEGDFAVIVEENNFDDSFKKNIRHIIKNGTPEEKHRLFLFHLWNVYWAKSVKEKKTATGKALSSIQNADLKNAVKGWKKGLEQCLSSKIEEKLSYTVSKVTDPYELFLIGSVGDTCQRIDGNPKNNKCLLAYPSDGKNQAIIIKNDAGKEEARAIIRFFYAIEDSENPQDQLDKRFPVLYLEAVYPGGASQTLKNAIELFAMDYAKEVNVPLVRKIKDKEVADFSHMLETIPGTDPFEYFDGAEHHVQKHSYRRPYGAVVQYRHYIPKDLVTLRYKPN